MFGMEKKPTLLLHCCCGPCSSSVLEQLASDYDITIFYYNPNTAPEEEYDKRAGELKKLLKIVGQNKAIYEKYDHEEFLSQIKGLESEPEGGKRCHKCYELRLKKTAQVAADKGFDFFTTTLSVSPYKNAELLNELGKKIGQELNSDKTKYLPANFKKRNGFLRVSQLCKEYGLYRQEYCGCEFSIR